MLYSNNNPGTVPYDDQTMFDFAAQDSEGWYWPGRHDYYLYDFPLTSLRGVDAREHTDKIVGLIIPTNEQLA